MQKVYYKVSFLVKKSNLGILRMKKYLENDVRTIKKKKNSKKRRLK